MKLSLTQNISCFAANASRRIAARAAALLV
jgi:hypothetical protein